MAIRIRRAPRVTCLALALTLAIVAGCTGGSPTRGVPSPIKSRGTGPETPGNGASTGPGATGAQTPPGGTGVATAGGLTPAAGIPVGERRVTAGQASTWAVDAAEGSLIGKIRGPSPLIASNGGKLISDQGTGLIASNGGKVVGNGGASVVSNNGSSYRLQAIEETVAVGLVVRVFGADGKPVTDAEGHPVEALTDAEGRYVFKGFQLRRNVVIVAELPEGRGRLSALAVRAAGANTVVDVDLASTVTAAYVLDRYVTSQADPAATLDKLTASAEIEAREQAARAVRARERVLPEKFDAPAASDLAAALRLEDKAFDQGMANIERILVPGGQRGLGEGLPATEAALAPITEIARWADGTTFLSSPYDLRVWRVDVDGTLRTAVGTGIRGNNAPAEGLLGTEFAIGTILAIAADGPDGLAILERSGRNLRLLRLGADGRLTVRWNGVNEGTDAYYFGFAGLVRSPEGLVMLVAPSDGAATAWRLPVGQGATKVHTFGEPEAAILRTGLRASGDGAGRAAVSISRQVDLPAVPGTGAPATTKIVSEALTLDLATFALKPVVTQSLKTQAWVTIDDSGRPVIQTLDNKLEVGMPIQQTVAAPGIPHFGAHDAVAADGAGGVFVATADLVFRIGAGGVKPFAGAANPPAEVPAGRLGLRDPVAFAADRDGRQVVFDAANRLTWKIDLDGIARRLGPLPAVVGDAPFTPVAVRLAGSEVLLLDDDDLGTDPHRFLAFDAAGKPREVFRATGVGAALLDVAGRAGGGYLALTRHDTDDEPLTEMLELGTDGQVLARHELTTAPTRMAVSPTGKVFLASDEKLASWTSADGEDELTVPSDWFTYWDFDTWIAADSAGRVYGNFGTVWRFDPDEDEEVVDLELAGDTVDSAITGLIIFPSVDAAGNLFYLEPSYRQIRLIKASDLP